MAEASAGLDGWQEHLQLAVDAAADAAAAEAAIVLAHGLSRAQRFAAAVEVLDRASSALNARHSELALRLVAASVVPGINDPTTAATAGRRAESLRARAAGDPAAPAEILAVAAFTSVLTNEPAEDGADLATRALRAGGAPGAGAFDGVCVGSDGRPWLSFAAWFSPTTLVLLWAERYAQLRPLLDDSITQARLTGDSSRRALVACPSYLPWRSEAALAHLALGDHESARRLADEELELASAFGAPRARGVALRAAGIVAGGDRGELLLRDAIDAFGRGDARLERARASADLGAMLRRRNRRVEAQQLLREALDTAHRAGAGTLAEYAETELRATGARPRRVVLTGLDSLTASERRIAEFASQGLINREIAQTLFVTARTVEGHLTSIFRKLRIKSRDELPAALAGLGAQVTA